MSEEAARYEYKWVEATNGPLSKAGAAGWRVIHVESRDGHVVEDFALMERRRM